jgi:hypothetical protein
MHTRLMSNSTATIWWTHSSDTILTSLNDNVLPSFSNCSALSIFIFVTVVLHLPLQALSTTLLFLSLKCYHHLNTIVQLFASVPYTFCTISNVSLLLLLSFTKNSIIHLCLKIYKILSSYIIAKQVSYKRSYRHTDVMEATQQFHLDEEHWMWAVLPISFLMKLLSYFLPPYIFQMYLNFLML